MMNSKEPDWEKTRRLLREHLTVPPLAHPDFINSRVLDEIGRERPAKRRATPMISLPRLAWSGVALLVAALGISLAYLPFALGPRSADQFISQVVEARAGSGRLSVTAFHAPNDPGVVLWVEGVEYIPSDQPVR